MNTLSVETDAADVQLSLKAEITITMMLAFALMDDNDEYGYYRSENRSQRDPSDIVRHCRHHNCVMDSWPSTPV